MPQHRPRSEAQELTAPGALRAGRTTTTTSPAASGRIQNAEGVARLEHERPVGRPRGRRDRPSRQIGLLVVRPDDKRFEASDRYHLEVPSSRLVRYSIGLYRPIPLITVLKIFPPFFVFLNSTICRRL